METKMAKRTQFALATAVTTAAVFAAAVPVAAFDCKNGYQLVQGNYIATPYCQDAYLTRVAHQYGMHVSASEIRENPNTKRRVCRLIGRDIRVQEACITVNPNGRGRPF
jgi:hypothetical protein